MERYSMFLGRKNHFMFTQLHFSLKVGSTPCTRTRRVLTPPTPRSRALCWGDAYNTNETFSAKNANNARIDFYGAVTAANEIRLGSETPLYNGPRVVSYGQTVLSGPMSVWNSFLRVGNDTSTLTLGGDITCLGGYYFVLQDASDYDGVRIFVTGRFLNLSTLYPDGNGTGVKFMSSGQEIAMPLEALVPPMTREQ